MGYGWSMHGLERSSLDTSMGLPSAYPAQSPVEAAATRERVPAIDRLRGLVMVLMALDHARAYFTDANFDALDLSKTHSALYWTRWVTHLCAPTFILLAGVSARLLAARMSRGALSRFLLTRGLWLIVLEVTLVQFAWSFNWRYERGVTLQVIWAIGASMLVLAAVVQLPMKAIAVFGLVMIAGHHVFDGFTGESWGPFAPVWQLLHVQTRVPFGMVVYPLLPWAGVMALGYALGGIYAWPAARRRNLLCVSAALSLVGFVVLRFANGYGDPHPWQPQASAWFTVLSFLNVAKYPPSLAYVLIMVGLACLLLALFEQGRARGLGVLAVYGRVPLFFYLMHLVVLHALAGLVGLLQGHGDVVLTHAFTQFPPSWGFSLPVVYLAWLLAVLVLYPVCTGFGRFKRQHAASFWASYI
jgi:uncharacterized membrane protein